MRVLVACEFSGVVREAFRRHGHDAWSCDLLPAEDGSEFHREQDALEVIKEEWDLMIAHPPCTYLTVAANKWLKPEYSNRFPLRRNHRACAIFFFNMLRRSHIPKFCIENPIGVMSTEWRKPDQIIHPYMFGHPVRKSTCLWLNGLPKLIPTNVVKPDLDKFPSGNTQSKWHTETGHIKDPIERSKVRSRTFLGIADAMAEQWG